MKKIFTSLIVLLLFSTSLFSQNVGIGLLNPTRAKFEVNGAVDATSAIFGGELGGISLQRNWAGIGYNSYYNGGDRAISNGYGAKQFFDNTSGYMYMDMLSAAVTNNLSSTSYRAFTLSPIGHVGIGGATPNAELQLPNTLDNRKLVLWETANNDHQYFGLGIEGGTMRYSIAGVGDVHRFYSGSGTSSSSLLMSIWGDKTVLISDLGGGGRLGINLNSTAYTLGFKQAGGTGLYIQEAASSTNWHLRAQYTAATSYAVLIMEHQGAQVGFFRPSGEYVWGSDSRIKTNVQPMPSTLERLMQLQPKIYEMKNNNPNHEKTLGFIAQEVKPLFPELVFTSKNSRLDGKGLEDMHSVSYSGFGIIAIKAIQEQQQLITQQQSQIDVLKKQLESIEKKLAER